MCIWSQSVDLNQSTHLDQLNTTLSGQRKKKNGIYVANYMYIKKVITYGMKSLVFYPLKLN